MTTVTAGKVAAVGSVRFDYCELVVTGEGRGSEDRASEDQGDVRFDRAD